VQVPVGVDDGYAARIGTENEIARFDRRRVGGNDGTVSSKLQRRTVGRGVSREVTRRKGCDIAPAIGEVDQLLRSTVGAHAALAFLGGRGRRRAPGRQSVAGALRRAVKIDASFADLGLGYTDAAVMAIAERDRLPVLTFDFEHFRATRPAHGFWELVVDEHRYQRHLGA